MRRHLVILKIFKEENMSKNLTNLIFNEVTRTNKNSISLSRKALRESESYTEDKTKTWKERKCQH